MHEEQTPPSHGAGSLSRLRTRPRRIGTHLPHGSRGSSRRACSRRRRCVLDERLDEPRAGARPQHWSDFTVFTASQELKARRMTLARKDRVPRRPVGVFAATGRRCARAKGCNHGRDPLVEPTHQVEQHLASSLGEGQVSLGRGPRSARLRRCIVRFCGYDGPVFENGWIRESPE